VLINAFEVPPDGDERFLAGWEQTRQFLRSQPGYLETRLHRSLSPEVDVRFVNIGRYASPQAFSGRHRAARLPPGRSGDPLPGPSRPVRRRAPLSQEGRPRRCSPAGATRPGAGLVREDVTAEVLAAGERRIVVYQALSAVCLLVGLVSTYAGIALLVLLQLNSAIAPRVRPLDRF
jgi:hypothetical protein